MIKRFPTFFNNKPNLVGDGLTLDQTYMIRETLHHPHWLGGSDVDSCCITIYLNCMKSF